LGKKFKELDKNGISERNCLEYLEKKVPLKREKRLDKIPQCDIVKTFSKTIEF
jgi:hypothetical protein